MILHHLPGIIWSGFMGLAIGNFATNPIYRLPRCVPLFHEDPFCDKCHAPLKPRDLFPVLSWLMTRGKCRYCGASVPGIYALMEALTCLVFIACYLQYGFSEKFIFLSFGMTSLLMLAMMLILDSFFSDRTLLVSMVLGMLFRTLADGTIYGFAGGAFAGLLAGAAAWKFSGREMTREAADFPSYLKLLVLAGVWLSLPRVLVVMAGALFALPFRGRQAWLVDWTIIGLTLIGLFIRT